MPAKAKKIQYARIKGLRAEQNMSMKSMAKILGISEVSYCFRENGKRDWRSSEMIRMAKYFKTSLDELFSA